MLRKKFNTGWRYRSIGNDRLPDVWKEVLLPHDAVIGSVRDPSQVNGMKKAFFPSGAWEYVNVFVPPEEWKGKEVFLEFEGVQNHALVYVNGNCAASHAYGYTEFTVPLSRYLRFGEKNFVRVVCSTHDDSRWYNGGGIYRNVNLLVGRDFRFLNNGLKIATLSADRERAELECSVALSKELEAELRFTLFREGNPVLERVFSVGGEGNMRSWGPYVSSPAFEGFMSSGMSTCSSPFRPRAEGTRRRGFDDWLAVDFLDSSLIVPGLSWRMEGTRTSTTFG